METKTIIKSAIIYTRFSPRPNAAECDSNEHQEARCVNYCLSRGYHGGVVFSDRSVSGKTANRPALNAAIQAIKPGMVLVVDRNDRLARDLLVALTIHHEVEQRGGTIEFADGSPLRTTPEGKLFQNLMAAFANYEREKFSERTKAGLARKKASGVWCGRPPIGWKKMKGQDALIVDEDEMECIREIFRCSSCGHTSATIADHLNAVAGLIRCKRWSARTIRKILTRKSAYLEFLS